MHIFPNVNKKHRVYTVSDKNLRKVPHIEKIFVIL
jgi:hypothetical protein